MKNMSEVRLKRNIERRKKQSEVKYKANMINCQVFREPDDNLRESNSKDSIINV